MDRRRKLDGRRARARSMLKLGWPVRVAYSNSRSGLEPEDQDKLLAYLLGYQLARECPTGRDPLELVATKAFRTGCREAERGTVG